MGGKRREEHRMDSGVAKKDGGPVLPVLARHNGVIFSGRDDYQ